MMTLPLIDLTLPCRFGCEDEPAVALVRLDRGCVVYPDHIQALCTQHVLNSMDGSLGDMTVLCILRTDDAPRKAGLPEQDR
jgi:hypothetical protein